MPVEEPEALLSPEFEGVATGTCPDKSPPCQYQDMTSTITLLELGVQKSRSISWVP